MPPSKALICEEEEELRAEPLDLEQVFRRYDAYVARLCFRVLGRREEVDDLVQLTFIHAWKGLRTLNNPGAARAWLATVAIRLARQHLRMRKLRTFIGLDRQSEETLGLEDGSASPEDRVMLAQVYRKLGQLPVEQQIAWTLRHVEGEPLEVVAQLCECSLATVKRRIDAAHTALKAIGRDG